MTLIDDYPYKHSSMDGIDPWGMYNRQCVSFVAFRLVNRNGYDFQRRGYSWNAKEWGENAQKMGFRVDQTPTPGSVAWSSSGEYGHVAWVHSVSGNQVQIEEYNVQWTGTYNHRVVDKGHFNGYIHFKDLPPKLDLSNYITTKPDFIKVIKDDFIYSSMDFAPANRKETLKAGTIVKITGLPYTADGYPRLQCDKGFISSNRVFVQEQNMSGYITSNSGYVKVIKDDFFYSSTDFADKNRVGTLKAGILVKINGIQYTADGYPRLACDKGFISSNKVFVQAQNMSGYITSNPGYVKVIKNDFFYSSTDFIPANRKEPLVTGTIVKINGIAYAPDGYPRLACDKGFISTNRVFVQEQNMSGYITSNPGYVKVIKADFFYSSTDFIPANRKEPLVTGTIVKINGIAYAPDGYPRLACDKGFISTNRVFVQEQNMSGYFTTNPGFVKVIKNDFFYSSTDFIPANRKEPLVTGTIVKINGITHAPDGYPRLMCDKGFISSNKVFTQVQNMSGYITSNPGYVKVIKNDYIYSSTDFIPTNRKEALVTGAVVKINGIAYAPDGYPRLVCDKGFISSNRVFVQEHR